ncbi:MAG: methyl-accepting chemotaxis protein [Bacteriovoracaceae bacterium]
MKVNLSLKSKILTLSLGIVVVLASMSFYVMDNLNSSKKELMSNTIGAYVKGLEASIAAQYYERYGDVQAFALNPSLQSENKDEIIKTLNNFVTLYQIYDLIAVVDKDGRLIATNEVKPDGVAISTTKLYEKNYAQEEWFIHTLNGQFTDDKDKGLLGTYVDQPAFDALSTLAYGQKLYGNGFSTQIKNKKGEVIGVLTNRAGFRWVEAEFTILSGIMEKSGFKDITINLFDKKGTVLSEFDTSKDQANMINRDDKVLNKLNLVEKKNNLVEELVAGKNGVGAGLDTITDRQMLGAYTPVRSNKFTESLGWGIMIRLDQESAFSEINHMSIIFYSIFAGLAILSCILALFFARTLTNKLNFIVENLNEGSGGLSKAAEDLSVISSKLSEGAVEQAAAIQETAASVDEVSAMIKKNSDNALQSQKTSNQGRNTAEEGKQAVEDMLVAIDDISKSNITIMQQVEDSNRQISEIVKVISEIGNKTKVINDIVFQTKLLSFNASVEAARAGEHGKGFAVVAEEVGNLAQMSGKAAKEISEMLTESINKVENIVKDTKSNVERLIIDGKGKIETGTATARACHQTLEKIIASVIEVDSMVVEIATASSEQAQGVSEINKAMNQLDEVTQFNSTMAQDSAKYGNDLKIQSRNLSGMVTELMGLIEGNSSLHETTKRISVNTTPEVHEYDQNKVIKLHSKKKEVQIVEKKVVGSDVTPQSEDPRFEDF